MIVVMTNPVRPFLQAQLTSVLDVELLIILHMVSAENVMRDAELAQEHNLLNVTLAQLQNTFTSSNTHA